MQRLLRHAAGSLTGLVITASICSPVRAAESPCTFEDQLVALQEARAQAPAESLAQTRAEATLRRETLRAIITCATREAEGLHTKLTDLTVDDSDAQRVRDALYGEFNSTLTFYAIQLTKVNDLGIRGSQEAARQLKEWRANIYHPLALRVVNFIIWNKNHELLQTADSRLAYISRTLESPHTTDEVSALLATAQERLADAHRSHDRAKTIFVENIRGSRDNAHEALNMIKESLQALSLTYEAFFNLYQLISA